MNGTGILGIEEGAIPIISDVTGFRAYYVVYAPAGVHLTAHGQRGCS
jgi:hypothetical protein